MMRQHSGITLYPSLAGPALRPLAATAGVALNIFLGCISSGRFAKFLTRLLYPD
jgi:hypothetical protein